MRTAPRTAPHSGGGRRGTLRTAALLAAAAAILILFFASDRQTAGVWATARAGWLLPGLALAAAAVGAALVRLARRPAGAERAALAAGAAMLVLLAAGLAMPGVRGRVATLLLATALLASALSLGAGLLAVLGFRPAGAAEGLALAGGLGLGALSLGYFLLGQVGLFRWPLLAVAALAGGAAGFRELVRLVARLPGEARRAISGAGLAGGALLALAAGLWLVRLAHCYSPPLLGHADYDALEYHLAAPLEWLRSGFVSFLAHNTYANMPAGAEMLWAPGLALAPGAFGGFYFARLMNLGCSELATLAVYAAARRLAGRRPAVLAAGLFFCGTWLADLTVSPYVEPLLLLYATAAALALLAAVGRGRFDLRRLALAGLLAGAACAVKYPALPFVAAPLAAAALLAGLARGLGGGLRPLAGAALVGALALAAASPWYLRNWFAAGNPVYPLAAGVFGSPAWDAQRLDAWRRAHAPNRTAPLALAEAFAGRRPERTPDGGVNLRSGATWENLCAGAVLAAFLPAAALGLWRRRRRGTVWAALLFAAYAAGWALFTHQVERFLWPAFGLLAMLAALGLAETDRGRAGKLAAGLCLAAALVAAPGQYLYVRLMRAEPPAAVLLGLGDESRFIEDVTPSGAWRGIEAVNSLPPSGRVVLFGEARAALFRVPVLYATVWDTNPLEEALAGAADAAEAARRLRSMGVTHVYCSWPELLRLRRSYGRPELGPDERRVLADLERDHLRLAASWGAGFGAASPFTGRRLAAYELWELTAGRAEAQR